MIDDRILAALREFLNAASSSQAAAVCERERRWLADTDALRVLSATVEGHCARPGHEADAAIVQARWDLLDRLLEVGAKEALAGFDDTVEAVLQGVNVPEGGRAVLDVTADQLARREADWVFADLLIQAGDDADTAALILRRWQGVRSATRNGSLRASPLPAAAARDERVATPAPPVPKSPTARIAGLEAALAQARSPGDEARRRDLRLDLCEAHLECRDGEPAQHLRTALATLDALQDELLACQHPGDELDRLQLLRTYVQLGATHQAIADFALQERGNAASLRSELDVARQAYQAAQSLAGARPVPPLIAFELYAGLGDLHAKVGDREDAIAYFIGAREAAQAAGVPAVIAAADFNLGNELAKSAATSPDQALLGIDHLRRALTFFTAAQWPGRRQPTLRALARALFRLRDWAGAELACGESLQLAEAELRTAADAATVRSLIGDQVDVVARSAYALLRLGRVDDAVRRLEQGKARAAAWRASLVLDAGETSLTSGIAPDGAAVVTVMTEAGAAAVVVPGATLRATGAAAPLSAANLAWLDRDAERSLLELAYGEEGWLNQYFRYAPVGDVRWDAAIDRLSGDLWPHYVGPIVERLQALGVPPGAEVVVVPWGRLAMLPLAIAWRSVGGQRRYAVDDYAFTQAPSLRLLARARGRAAEPQRQGLQLLAVGDPRDDLPGALDECRRVAGRFVGRGAPPPIELTSRHATLAATLEGLTRSNCWLFSCHGHFHWGQAELSALHLAGDDVLTLQALAALDDTGHCVRLAVLNACESGLASVLGAVDEIEGFPTQLMTLGVPAVVASLWPVDDAASAALLERYFDHWLDAGPQASPARTLRHAQLAMMAMPARAFDPAAPAEATLRERPFYWGAYAASGC